MLPPTPSIFFIKEVNMFSSIIPVEIFQQLIQILHLKILTECKFQANVNPTEVEIYVYRYNKDIHMYYSAQFSNHGLHNTYFCVTSSLLYINYANSLMNLNQDCDRYAPRLPPLPSALTHSISLASRFLAVFGIDQRVCRQYVVLQWLLASA